MDIKPIPGWFDDERAKTLKKLIDKHEIKTVLEIGSYLGKSAEFFANNVDHVTCIDPFKMWTEGKDNRDTDGVPEDFFPVFKKNLEERGLWDKVTAIPLSSDEAIKELPMFKTFDLIYIDGAHDFNSVLKDLKNYLPFARKIICGDDHDENWPGVVNAVDEMFGGFQNSVSNEGKIWWVETSI